MTTYDDSAIPSRGDLDEHKARHFRTVNFDPQMEEWLRVRAEDPRRFETLHPLVQDQAQIYADLRAPYTAALAAREEQLRKSWRRKGGTDETFDHAVEAGAVVIEIDGINADWTRRTSR